MYRFTLSAIIITCVMAGTWSVLDRHIFTAACYYAAAAVFYLKLERDVFRD